MKSTSKLLSVFLNLSLMVLLSSKALALDPNKANLQVVIQHAQAEAIKEGKSKTFEIAELGELHPTQADLGEFEVEYKKNGLMKLSQEKFDSYLESRTIPVARAPDGKLYIIDHHHFSRTVLEMGMTHAVVEIWGDFSEMESMDKFWDKMTDLKWAFLFDRDGKAILPSQLPKTLKEMGNNFYRSLAYALRLSGGFEETEVPFFEFWWGRLLQKHITLTEGGWKKLFDSLLGMTDSKDFLKEPIIQEAHRIAVSDEAKNLPGYIGDCKSKLSDSGGHL